MLHRRLHTFAVLGLALFAAFLLAGCVQLEQRLLLNGDGSLAIAYHYSVAEDSEPLLSSGARAIQEWQGRLAGPPSWFTSEEAVRQHFAATGVQVQKYRTYREAGRRHVDVLLFAEYGPAALNSGLLGPLRCDRPREGVIRLAAELPAIPKNAAGLDAEAMAALVQDLYLRLEVNVPGEVLETTAGTRTRATAVWTFDPGKDTSFLRTMPRIECLFDAKRLDWATRVPVATAP